MKGKIGELAVQKSLVSQNYAIYLPAVDLGVDLIVECSNGAMKRVQIKTVIASRRNTAIEVNTSKYKDINKVDVVAVYYLPKDIIAYVPYNNDLSLTLALSTSKNNQLKHRKWFYSYDRFPEFK